MSTAWGGGFWARRYGEGLLSTKNAKVKEIQKKNRRNGNGLV